jgi:hypothetical protein
MTRLKVCIALAVVCCSCTVGRQAGNFRLAQAPAGVEATVATDGGGALMRGELLSVDDTSLLILVNRQVTRVPYTRIRKASFMQAGVTITDVPPTKLVKDQLHLLSRYPQGVSPALLRSLLAAYGQAEVVVAPTS